MLIGLSVRNFKSIKELDLDCKKINVFIGEPNAGKSNILEIIGFLSHFKRGKLREFVRYETINNLFYDQIIDSDITIGLDSEYFNLKWDDNRVETTCDRGGTVWHVGSTDASGNEDFSTIPDIEIYLEQFKYYNFLSLDRYTRRGLSYLNPPNGNNLTDLILTQNPIKKLVSDIIQKFGYRLIIEQPTTRIRILKEQGDIFILFPYSTIADTIQSLIFYMLSIKTNKDSIIAFNEPEAKAFPYYTRLLAENIANDNQGNQYFISTHNPYFLTTILEKSNREDISINITYMEKYETKVITLNQSQKSDILDNVLDPFFNIQKYLDK